MRRLAPLLTLALLAAGCISPPAEDAPRAPTDAREPVSCPAGEGAAPPTEGAHAVQVQLANARPEPTCVRVYFDDVLVAVAQLPAEHPALHANPRPVADFAWDAAEVTVRVEDEATGRAHEETVRLAARAWVAAWVDDAATNVETYDEAPAWM